MSATAREVLNAVASGTLTVDDLAEQLNRMTRVEVAELALSATAEGARVVGLVGEVDLLGSQLAALARVEALLRPEGLTPEEALGVAPRSLLDAEAQLASLAGVLAALLSAPGAPDPATYLGAVRSALFEGAAS